MMCAWLCNFKSLVFLQLNVEQSSLITESCILLITKCWNLRIDNYSYIRYWWRTRWESKATETHTHMRGFSNSRYHAYIVSKRNVDTCCQSSAPKSKSSKYLMCASLALHAFWLAILMLSIYRNGWKYDIHTTTSSTLILPLPSPLLLVQIVTFDLNERVQRDAYLCYWWTRMHCYILLRKGFYERRLLSVFFFFYFYFFCWAFASFRNTSRLVKFEQYFDVWL